METEDFLETVEVDMKTTTKEKVILIEMIGVAIHPLTTWILEMNTKPDREIGMIIEWATLEIEISKISIIEVLI